MCIGTGELQMRGLFPCAGSFGSPDGVGGQGSLLFATDGASIAIGDQGGRLYKLRTA